MDQSRQESIDSLAMFLIELPGIRAAVPHRYKAAAFVKPPLFDRQGAIVPGLQLNRNQRAH